LYFDNEDAWEEFFISYYALTNLKVGESEALPHIFNNLALLTEEKDAMFNRIINCNSLMTIIDAVEEYDSYMIDEDDINNNNDFGYSSFNRAAFAGRRWNADNFNFLVPVLTFAWDNTGALDERPFAECANDSFDILVGDALLRTGSDYVNDRLGVLAQDMLADATGFKKHFRYKTLLTDYLIEKNNTY